MREMLNRMMRCHGRRLTVKTGNGEQEIRGFLQPVNSKAMAAARWEMSPLGVEPGDRFVYIGPPDPALERGDALACDGKTYLVRSGQVIYDGDAPLYCRAMCTEKGGEDDWGMNLASNG